MALHSYRKADEWWTAQHDGNSHVEKDGDLVLLPDDLAENQYFAEVDEFGDAVGYPTAEILGPDGYLVAATPVGGGDDSLSFQNLSPLPSERPGFVFDRPHFEGRRPVRDPAHAADLPRPAAAPTVTLEPAGRAGLAGGPRFYRRTYVTPEGRHTTAGPAVQATNAPGQVVRMKAPPDVPEDLRIGEFVGEPGKGPETCRLQRVWDPRDGEVVLSTYRFDTRRVPTRNETFLGRPPRRRFGREVKLDRYSHGDLVAAEWAFVATYSTAFGESLPSVLDDVRETPKALEDTAWWVRRPPRRAGARGFRLYVRIDGQWFLVIPTVRLDAPAHHWPYSGVVERVPVTAASSGIGDAENAPEYLRGLRRRLVPMEPPVEDLSGVEGPTSEPEPPVAEGPALPAAGRRRFAYARTKGEEVGPLSPSVTVDVPAGRVARVTVPRSCGLIPNAEGVEVDAQGIPYDLTVAQTGGSYRYASGVHVIQTAGPQAGTTPSFEFARVEHSADKPLTAVGEVKVAAAAGEGVVVLRQHRADGSVAETELARIGGNDYRKIEATFVEGGPPLDAALTAVSLAVRMSGATKNMTVEGWNFDLFPFPFAPPKVEKPPRGTREPADFDPPPEKPYPLGSYEAVGPPPGPVAAAPEPPIARVSLAGGALDPSGGFGLVNARPSDPNSLAEITPAAALAGQTHGLRARDLSSASKNAIFFSAAFGARTEVAVRFPFRPVSPANPAAVGRFVVLANIGNRVFGDVAQVRHYKSNRLTLATRRPGFPWAETNLPYVGPEHEVDAELVAGNLATGSGYATALLGINGRARSVAATRGGLPWQNLDADFAAYGVVFESEQAMSWEYLFGEGVLTPRGDVIDSGRPPSTQPFVPDAPLGAGGSPVLFGEGDPPERINRRVLFVLPDEPEKPVGMPPTLLARVKPGQTYAVSVPGRHSMPREASPWWPWFLSLRNPRAGLSRDVGSLYGAAGCSGISGWAERAVEPFVVPEGFTELWVEDRGFPAGGGLFVWHGQVKVSEGLVPKGGHNRKTRTKVTALIDARTPKRGPDTPPLKEGWLSCGVVSDDGGDPATDVASRFRPTDDPLGISFPGPWTDDPEEAARGARDLLSVEMVLTGDGKKTPRVPLYGPAVRSAPFDAQLLRADGSELPGGSLVRQLGNRYERPKYDLTEVGGVIRAGAASPKVKRLPAFAVQVFTEEAARELEEEFLETEWTIESPTHDGRGVVLRIRGEHELDVADSSASDVAEVDGEAFREVLGVAEVRGAVVLESRPLVAAPGGYRGILP